MNLYTQEQYEQLVKNGLPENSGKDHIPVVKWVIPDANCTWLVTELEDNDTAFGLCDLGLGSPELGYISLEDIQSLRGTMGLTVESDWCFDPKHPLSVYVSAAHFAIEEDEHELEYHANGLKESAETGEPFPW
jgi:hypothetical protein